MPTAWSACAPAALLQVVLVNLLVAMFSDTFSRVKEGAEEVSSSEFWICASHLSANTPHPTQIAPTARMLVKPLAAGIHALQVRKTLLPDHVMHPLPPPFNLPIALYSLTKRAIRSAKQLYSAYSARGSMIPGRGLREAERRSLLDSIHLRNKSEASSERANDGRQLVRKYTMQQEREKTESSLEVANALKSKLDELMRMHTVLASEIAENGTSRSRAVDRLRNTVGHEQSAHLEQGGADDRGGKARAPPTIDETSPKHDFFALSFFKIPAHTTKDTISAAVKTTSSIASKLADGLEVSKQTGEGMAEGLAEGLRIAASPVREPTSSACTCESSTPSDGDSERRAVTWPSLVEDRSPIMRVEI
jgi:hypothetical protein